MSLLSRSDEEKAADFDVVERILEPGYRGKHPGGIKLAIKEGRLRSEGLDNLEKAMASSHLQAIRYYLPRMDTETHDRAMNTIAEISKKHGFIQERVAA